MKRHVTALDDGYGDDDRVADGGPDRPRPPTSRDRVVVDDGRRSRSEDPCDLGDDGLAVGDVAQEVGGEDPRHRAVRQGPQLRDGIGLDETHPCRPDLPPGLVEHTPGGVDADDVERCAGMGAQPRGIQRRGGRTRAATEVEDRPTAFRQPGDERLGGASELVVVARGEGDHRVVGRCGPVEGVRERPVTGRSRMPGAHAMFPGLSRPLVSAA